MHEKIIYQLKFLEKVIRKKFLINFLINL